MTKTCQTTFTFIVSRENGYRFAGVKSCKMCQMGTGLRGSKAVRCVKWVQVLLGVTKTCKTRFTFLIFCGQPVPQEKVRVPGVAPLTTPEQRNSPE